MENSVRKNQQNRHSSQETKNFIQSKTKHRPEVDKSKEKVTRNETVEDKTKITTRQHGMKAEPKKNLAEGKKATNNAEKKKIDTKTVAVTLAKERSKTKGEEIVKTQEKNEKMKIPSRGHAGAAVLPEKQKLNKERVQIESSKEDFEQEYEDDFEDYEEDFEEPEEESSEEEAMAEEASDENQNEFNNDTNSRFTGHLKTNQITSIIQPSDDNKVKNAIVNGDHVPKENAPEKVPTQPKNLSSSSNRQTTARIDFRKASLTEAQLEAAGRTQIRYQELNGIIDLDTTFLDIFEMAPVKDYEYFMLSHGKGNRKQAQQQTGEDCLSREVQSEDPDVVSKWCQFPAVSSCACGSDDGAIMRSTIKENEENNAFNSKHFSVFIEKAGKLMEQLQNDELSFAISTLKNNSKKPFSDTFSILSLEGLAKKYETRHCLLPADPSRPIITVHFIEESVAHDLMGRGVVCVWNLHELTMPAKILLCNSKPCCASISPDLQSVVICGCDDSSLVVWDLQEPNFIHKSVPWRDRDISLRSPSYDTACLVEETEAIAPIVSLMVLTDSNSVASYTAQSNYQVAALNGGGVVTIWAVLRGIRAMTGTGSNHDDLGLRIGAKLKLVKTSILEPSKTIRYSSNSAFMRVYCMKKGLKNFYVGTDTGCILRLARYEENKSGPSIYYPQFDSLADVLCMTFSPFECSIVLAGLSDGSIYAYKVGMSKPLTSFTLGRNCDPVNAIQWSPCNPYVFYSLNGNKSICTWDLKINRTGPVHVEHVAGCTQIYSPIEHSTGRKAFMSLTFDNGFVEIHCLKDGGKTYTAEDGQKLATIIERL